MRWRNGLMDLLELVMGLSPVLLVAVWEQQPQHRWAHAASTNACETLATPYRASGLVLRPEAATHKSEIEV